MGRCARLAWEHGADYLASSNVPRPGVMTAHILLGVLKETDCAGGLILAKMGVDLMLAYKHTEFLLLHGRRREGESTIEQWDLTDHTAQAKLIMEYALDEAQLYSDTYPIGTEHMLLGLLRVTEGGGCKVLNYFGIDETGVRATRNEWWDVLPLSE
jgi:ATP-dependent Clp protease ATP-binding subunit ClpA